MNTTYKSLEGEAKTDLYQEMETLIKKNPWTWQCVCAVLGLAGGVIAPILGAISDVMTWFVSSKAAISSLYVLSIVFCALTIPLLALGAFCLDSLESKTTQLSPPPRPPRDESTMATAIRRFARPNANHNLNRTGALTWLVFLLALPASGHAQQTVFNVPTTDVLDRGQVYFELDISARPVDPKFSSFVPRLVVGTGGNVEIGLNLTGNIQPGADLTMLVQALKWKVYDGKDNGWAIAVGHNLFIPVRNKTYDAGTYAYTMFQKKFKTKLRTAKASNYHLVQRYFQIGIFI